MIVRYSYNGKQLDTMQLSVSEASLVEKSMRECPQFSDIEILNDDGTPYEHEPLHAEH